MDHLLSLIPSDFQFSWKELHRPHSFGLFSISVALQPRLSLSSAFGHLKVCRVWSREPAYSRGTLGFHPTWREVPLLSIRPLWETYICFGIFGCQEGTMLRGPSRPPKWDLFGKVKELGRTGVQKSIQVMMHQYLSQRHGPTGLDTSEFGWERSSGQAGKRMFQKSETFGTVHHQLFFVETKLRSICIYIYIYHDIIQCWALRCKTFYILCMYLLQNGLTILKTGVNFHKSC